MSHAQKSRMQCNSLRKRPIGTINGVAQYRQTPNGSLDTKLVRSPRLGPETKPLAPLGEV